MSLYNNLILDGDNKFELSPIQLRIFEELIGGQMVSRKEFVERLHTARTTVYDNLVKLQNIKINGAQLLRVFSKNNGLRGRPIVHWYIPRIILEKFRREKW